MTRADLTLADLRGADMTDARMKEVRARRAKYDERTVFPAGFIPVEAGMILEERVA